MKYRVFLLDTEIRTQNRYIPISLRAALEQHPEVECVTLGTHGTAIRDFVDGRYDIFLAFGGAGNHSPLLTRLCKLARFSVLWTTEDPYELRVNVEFSDCFDIVFTNDYASTPAYGGRARHLPLAASELFNDFVVKEHDEAYRYDLLFIGTAWPNRVASLNKIVRRFKGKLRTKFALPYNPFLQTPELADPTLLINWRCSNIAFARLANSSRVVLSLPRSFSAAEQNQMMGSTPPPRLFEVALAGGFQVYVSDGDEAKRYFEDGAEFDYCEDIDAAIRAIERALDDPRTRVAKAQAARARARSEHCYSHRIAEIMEIVKKLCPFNPLGAQTAGRRTLLIVTHNMLGDRPGGGVEIYQEQLRHLPASYRILYLYTSLHENQHVLRVTGDGDQKDYYISAPSHQHALINPEFEGAFERILFECKVDIVHFQHLIGFPLSLPLISRACGVPSIWTLHDYYLICDRYNLLDFEMKFCDIACKSIDHCDVCLTAGGLLKGSQTRRRNFVSVIVQAFDVLIASTVYTRQYIIGMFPEIDASRIETIEMLMPHASRKTLKEQGWAKTQLGRPLRVVVPGNFSDIKGAHYLVRLFNLTRDLDIYYTLLGRIDGDFVQILSNLDLKNIDIRNGYEQEAVCAILGQFDVSLHTSLWPETYMISLSEAWASGLIPIVTDLGAQGERVTDGVDGFKVPAHDVAAIVQCLRRIRLGMVPLAEMLARISEKRLNSTHDHLNLLHAVYDRVIKQRPVPHLDYPIRHRRRFALHAADTGIRVNAPTWSRTDIVWDQPLLPSAVVDNTVEQVLPKVLDDIPPMYGHLSKRVMKAAADGLRIELDRIETDDDPRDPTMRRLTAQHSARIVGWMHLPNTYHVESYFRLSSISVEVLFVAETKIRQDIVELFQGDSTAERSGFDGVIDVGLLPDGDYELSLVTVFDGLILEFQNLIELEVSRLAYRSSEGFPQHWDEKSLENTAPPPSKFGVGTYPEDVMRKHGHLPTRILPAETDSLRVEIDEIEADRKPLDSKLRQWVAGRSARIVGWMHLPQFNHVEFYFRMKNSSVNVLVPIRTKTRRDISELFPDDSAAERSGFEGILSLAPFPEDLYNLSLLAVSDRLLVEIPDLMQLKVSRRSTGLKAGALQSAREHRPVDQKFEVPVPERSPRVRQNRRQGSGNDRSKIRV